MEAKFAPEYLTAHWEPSAVQKKLLEPDRYKTPDEVQRLTARIAVLELGYGALVARIAALEPHAPPAFSSLDEFVRPRTVQWPFAWHGRPDARPGSLPKIVTLDKLEAITRARWGYDPEGRQVKAGTAYDKAWRAVDEFRVAFVGLVAHAVALPVLDRFDGVDPEFACFGTLLGLWPPTSQEQLDGQPTPADFKGVTVESYIKQFQNIPEVEEP